MNRFRLHSPELANRSVRFRWEVAPRSSLYRAHAFTLRFPADVDIHRVPEDIWRLTAMICLHAHWPLLRPCRVELPFNPGAADLSLWSRLLAAEAATLDALREAESPTTAIEIDFEGPALSTAPVLPESGRCAAAFSGGKDSLLQAALLADLTDAPVLVTTTSPLPPLQDHSTPRREHVLAEVRRRLNVRLIEVQSNYRSVWDNRFAERQGYPLAVNELTDTFLYLGALLAVGAALGAPHLFLASEAEVQETAEHGGRIIQHKHYMYSVATQRALQALLTRRGFRYGSLTSPLHSSQVQQLLWSRYPQLSDLQYSCWRVRPPQAACSECVQCLRIAMTALASGRNPERAGIDLEVLFPALAEWSPLRPDSDPEDLLPSARVARDLHGSIFRSLARTPTSRVARALLRGSWRRAFSKRARRALSSYAQLRRRLSPLAAGEDPGYRAGFLPMLDPLLRDRVGAIYHAAFREQPPSQYAATLARGDALARWITEPLDAQA